MSAWHERQRRWALRHPRAAPWARSFTGGAGALLSVAAVVAVWDIVGEPPIPAWVLATMGVAYAALMRVVIAVAAFTAGKR